MARLRMERCLGVLVMFVALPEVAADHADGCAFTSQDPATYTVVDVPGPGPYAGRYYVQEDDVPEPLDESPPVPGSGYLLGRGTWIYEEANGLPGLQRGGIIEFPYCTPPAPAPPILCLDEPVQDETCGHGPDAEVFSLWMGN